MMGLENLNLGYHFDRNLHEVPDSLTDMREAIRILESRLGQATEDDEIMEILGSLANYCRITGRLDEAEAYIMTAISRLGLPAVERRKQRNFVFRLRLAHIHHWEKRFDESNHEFAAMVNEAESDPDLAPYLDFAYQHYGKNLFDQERYEEALDYFERALELRRAGGRSRDLVKSSLLAKQETERRMHVHA